MGRFVLEARTGERCSHVLWEEEVRMKMSNSLVLVVENNAAVLAGLRRLLQSAHYRVRAFSSLRDIRELLPESDSPSCAIVDLDLPRGGGIAVQTFLNETYPGMPVIFVSTHADVPSSVRVMKAGALDLLVTPLDEHTLLTDVRNAVAQERRAHEDRQQLADIRKHIETLTRREAQVLECLLRGLLNKQTAAELGTCEKTIKVHRGRIMRKMQVQSIAQLVQRVMRVRGSMAPLALQPPTPRPRSRRYVRPSAN